MSLTQNARLGGTDRRRFRHRSSLHAAPARSCRQPARGAPPGPGCAALLPFSEDPAPAAGRGPREKRVNPGLVEEAAWSPRLFYAPHVSFSGVNLEYFRHPFVVLCDPGVVMLMGGTEARGAQRRGSRHADTFL